MKSPNRTLLTLTFILSLTACSPGDPPLPATGTVPPKPANQGAPVQDQLLTIANKALHETSMPRELQVSPEFIVSRVSVQGGLATITTNGPQPTVAAWEAARSRINDALIKQTATAIQAVNSSQNSTLQAQAAECAGAAVRTDDFPGVVPKAFSSARVIVSAGHGLTQADDNSGTYNYQSNDLDRLNEDENNNKIGLRISSQINSLGGFADNIRGGSYSAAFTLKSRGLPEAIWNTEGDKYGTCNIGKDLRSRALYANYVNANGFISVHSTPGRTDFSNNRTTIYFSSTYTNPSGTEDYQAASTKWGSALLADLIGRRLQALGGTTATGYTIKEDNTLGEIRRARMPAVLAEIARDQVTFHYDEYTWLQNTTSQDQMGQVIALAWRDFNTATNVNPQIISPQDTGRCIDVAGGSKDRGAGLLQWDCHGGDNQSFRLISFNAAQGTYQITAKHASLCVSISSTNDGTALVQDTCKGTPEQLWKTYVSNGYIRFTNLKTNKCMDIAGGSKAAGATVQLYSCNNTPAQWFRVGAISPIPGSNTYSPPKVNLLRAGTNLAVNGRPYPTMTYMWLYPRDLNDAEQMFDLFTKGNFGGNAGVMLRRQGTNNCLNAYQPANYSDLILYTCSGADADQQWEILNNGSTKMLRNRGFCLNAPYLYINGRVTMWTCDFNDPDQQFTF